MGKEKENKIIQEHFAALQEEYPTFNLLSVNKIAWIAKGLVSFIGSYSATTIKDSFELEIVITDRYPNDLPLVREIDGRISKDFHKYSNGCLCLGVSLEIRRIFSENPTLIGFVQHLVIPYLFSFCYYRQYNIMPYGELSHGSKGIFEYYRQLFLVHTDAAVIGLLKILAKKGNIKNEDCPCGSGKNIWSCHGKQILKIKKHQSQIDFLYDYDLCLQIPKKRDEDILQPLLKKAFDKCEEKASENLLSLPLFMKQN